MFTKTEVRRRFRAARKAHLGGNTYIIHFQDRGYHCTPEEQYQHHCISSWSLTSFQAWKLNPVREEWAGGMCHSIEEWNGLPEGFVFDVCRYVRESPNNVAKGCDPILELYDNCYVWLGTSYKAPKVFRYGELLSGWCDVSYPVRHFFSLDS